MISIKNSVFSCYKRITSFWHFIKIAYTRWWIRKKMSIWKFSPRIFPVTLFLYVATKLDDVLLCYTWWCIGCARSTRSVCVLLCVIFLNFSSMQSSCFRNSEVHVYHIYWRNSSMKKGPPRPFHRQQKMPKNLMRQKKLHKI